MIARVARWLVAAVLAVGCGTPPEGEGVGESTGTDASTAGSTSTGSSAGEGSLSMTGASASTSNEESSSGFGSGSSGSTGSSSGGTTTASDPCAGLEPDPCMADSSCTPIVCQPYVMEATVCIGAHEFIGCRSAEIGCVGGRTHTCDGEPVFVCADSCIPEGWRLCDPPVQGAMQCG